MGLLLFVPAGTVHYWQAWIYIGLYFGASLLITLYLMKKDPALLKRRLSGGPTAEKVETQKIIMLFASTGFMVIAGDMLTALWFYIMFLVFKENAFSSATIEIAKDQRVISTGPYAFVRHPMYVGGLLLFIGTPLALGSYWGLLAFVIVLPALIWRLLDEEKFLARNLPGYVEYCAKVRWRLIPGVF
jgi:protein-S-isoprenylcysteine O-methyltransferase Ste14